MGWWPSPAVSTRSALWPRRPKTWPCSWRSSPVTTRPTRLPSICPCRRIRKTVRQPLAGLRLGMVREHFGDGLDAEVDAAVREAVRVYESLGAKVTWLSMPHSKYAVAVYYIIAPCEASSNLARYDGVHYGYRTDEKQMLADLQAEQARLQKAGDKRRRWRISTIR